MALEEKPQKVTRVETSFLPLRYVDLIEDIFHAALAVVLLVISVGAFYQSMMRLIRTEPFFPNGNIQAILSPTSKRLSAWRHRSVNS
jgi:hypothetical protein